MQHGIASRVFKGGCLLFLLALCGGLTLLTAAVVAGDSGVALPGGSVLKVGADNFVLSNYSFQDGTSYFIDLNGNGTRNIVELNYLSTGRKVEFVLHYANREAEGEHRLATLPLP